MKGDEEEEEEKDKILEGEEEEEEEEEEQHLFAALELAWNLPKEEGLNGNLDEGQQGVDAAVLFEQLWDEIVMEGEEVRMRMRRRRRTRISLVGET